MRRSAYTRVLTAGVLAVVLVAGGSAGAGAAEPDGSQPESGLPAQVEVGSDGGEAQDGAPTDLSISVDSAVSLSASCDSPTLKAGQSWVSWAQGARYQYKIQTTELVGGKPVPGSSPKTSGVLYAFNPNPAYITCGLG